MAATLPSINEARIVVTSHLKAQGHADLFSCVVARADKKKPPGASGRLALRVRLTSCGSSYCDRVHGRASYCTGGHGYTGHASCCSDDHGHSDRDANGDDYSNDVRRRSEGSRHLAGHKLHFRQVRQSFAINLQDHYRPARRLLMEQPKPEQWRVLDPRGGGTFAFLLFPLNSVKALPKRVKEERASGPNPFLFLARKLREVRDAHILEHARAL